MKIEDLLGRQFKVTSEYIIDGEKSIIYSISTDIIIKDNIKYVNILWNYNGEDDSSFYTAELVMDFFRNETWILQEN